MSDARAEEPWRVVGETSGDVPRVDSEARQRYDEQVDNTEMDPASRL